MIMDIAKWRVSIIIFLRKNIEENLCYYVKYDFFFYWEHGDLYRD